MAEGRTIEACDQALNCLTEPQKKAVKAVSMDMWQAYETSVTKNLPNADIVHDVFHISKYLNDAVDKVRRSENRQLQAEGDDRLTGMKYAVLFNPQI
ncbi:MAG: transposase [Fuerstiella sp.]